MKIVRIKEGTYYNKPIVGDFKFVGTKEKDAECKGDLYLRVIRNGKEINVHVHKEDFTMLNGVEDNEVNIQSNFGAGGILMNDDELGLLIKQRFDVMDQLTEFVVQGAVSSVIISGAAGIGKSFNLGERLEKAIDDSEINQYDFLKGRMSAIALYAQLYEYRTRGDILVLDDTDDVFKDETSLNILKAVLDTGDVRKVSWNTASPWLEEMGVPNSFEFEGAIVFLTNMDFDKMIERQNPIAAHLKALMGRTNYLDLGIHTNHEIMIRIKQVIGTSSMLDQHDITDQQKVDMMVWLEGHYEEMRELSLRTILKLASFIKGDPKGWQVIAKATMLRHTRF